MRVVLRGCQAHGGTLLMLQQQYCVGIDCCNKSPVQPAYLTQPSPLAAKQLPT